MKHRGEKWTNEEISKAIELYNQGLTISEISKQVNHSDSGVTHKLKFVGVEKGKRVDWTEKECEKLKELYEQHLSYSEIGKILGRTTRACQGKAVKLGLKTKECNVWLTHSREDFWKEEDIETVKRLINEGYATKEIAEKVNRSEKSLFNKMAQLNLHIQEKTREQKSLYRRVYIVDDNYFENIDSQKKAYWLGWIITDGSVSEKFCTKRGVVQANRLGLKLKSDDKDVLEDIKNDMKSTFPLKLIKKRKEYEYINKQDGARRIVKSGEQIEYVVTSSKIVSDLKKYSIHQNKTYDVLFPELLNEKYYPGFIAGVISGDGSINIKETKKRNFLRTNIAGTYSLLEGIKKVLIDNINFNPEKKIMKIKRTKCLYNIELNQTETITLYNWFNENGISLMPRKDKIIKDFIADSQKS